ncbi:MAG: TonB-dependent receptor [Candidatus Aureabacteria bacterium]|nr:TonB-dependent receptor [Candidatus Auribacterota bacterium]
MKKIITILLMLSLAAIYMPSVSMAQEGMEDLLFMEIPVVYETTKREEKTQESALNIRVITREDIENYGLTDYKDLMMFIENGFETFKGRDRVFGTRGIMGYANDKIKFLIDGQEFPMMYGLGEGMLPVTLDEVKRIEVVKGPNTSLFGGNSVQATINIIRYNGNDFVGVKTGVAIGRWNHKRGFIHYAEKPSDDVNYDLYFATGMQDGPNTMRIEWGGTAAQANGHFKHDIDNPIPDYELIASVNAENMRLKYRRVIGRRDASNEIPTHDYSDAFAAEYKKPGIFGNDDLDLIVSIEASHFGNWYDVYHGHDGSDYSGMALEHKAEKRLEWDAHVYYNPEENWDLLAGISGNYWSGVGTEWGTVTSTTSTTDIPYFYLAPTLVTAGTSTPEFFPSFGEINDLADWELWADFKYQINDQTSIVLGGRYVYDFVPNDQLRDSDSIAKYNTDRELLRQFFPKAAIVYSPAENMYLKLIYQEGFNRPNTFEQFSAQNTIPMRGMNKATTADTLELVLDWVINKNMKTVVSAFTSSMENFMNFAYTGPGWPVVDASAGQVRGFVNVGDRKVDGIEANFDLKYENYGGFIGLGYLLKNKVEPYAKYTAAVAGTGATGIVSAPADSNLTKQSYPEYSINVGAWMKLLDTVTLSTLYSTHQNLQNSATDWSGTYLESDIDTWDIILNAKDVLTENLDLQIMVKNILDNTELNGGALDPAHSETQWPRYYEGKITYLW